MGELACQPEKDRAEPLIVDRSSDDRSDLEIAMRDGLACAGRRLVASLERESSLDLARDDRQAPQLGLACRSTQTYTMPAPGRAEWAQR